MATLVVSDKKLEQTKVTLKAKGNSQTFYVNGTNPEELKVKIVSSLTQGNGGVIENKEMPQVVFKKRGRRPKILPGATSDTIN